MAPPDRGRPDLSPVRIFTRQPGREECLLVLAGGFSKVQKTKYKSQTNSKIKIQKSKLSNGGVLLFVFLDFGFLRFVCILLFEI